MKMVFAEQWVIDAITSQSRPLETLLSIPKLLDTLSPDDVAFYLAFNDNLKKFIPEEIVNSFDAPFSGYSDHATLELKDALLRRKMVSGDYSPKEAFDKDMLLSCEILGADTILFRYIAKSDIQKRAGYKYMTLPERIIRQMDAIVPTQDKNSIMLKPVWNMYLKMRQKELRPVENPIV